MKRSEFIEKEVEQMLGVEPRGDQYYMGQIEAQVEQYAFAAERAGVTWDPEEPEVLWEGPDTEDVWPCRILADGSVEHLPRGDEWESFNCPAAHELARRILEERKEEKELDDAMDEAERKFSEDLRKLESLEREAATLKDLGFHGRAADFYRLAGETDRYRKFLVVWNLWGPDGTLRRKLAGWTTEELHGASRSLLRQLRSELLALPWEVMK